MNLFETLHESEHEQVVFLHNKSAGLLRTCKGLGAYGALGLAARIGDVRRFERPRSLANYFGLTPRCRNSGEQTDRLGSITKEGSRFARFILAQLVLHVLKHDGEMRGGAMAAGSFS